MEVKHLVELIKNAPIPNIIGVRMNPLFYRKLVSSDRVRVHSGDKYNPVTGLRIDLDDSVETYEFIEREELR